MTCIYCFQKLSSGLSWENIITGHNEQKLCSQCRDSFIKLNGLLCVKCSAESQTKICLDCLEWSNKYGGNDVLTKNYSVFKYNEFSQEFLATWKYQGDFVLIEGITELLTMYIKNNFNLVDSPYTIIPIPLSKERLAERAFNQAALIAKLFGNIDESTLSKRNSKKQSKKTKQERINSINTFKVNKNINGKVLLIDDIYTTGSTIRHAATLLLERGASEVKSFTFIRS